MALSPEQYKTIMRTYDRNLTRAMRIQSEHLAEVREKVPGFSELEDKSSRTAVDFARRRLDHPELDLSELDSSLKSISDEKEKLLKDHGYDPAYIEPAYTCPDCRDTGYIGSRKCHCFRQAEIALLYRQSNIREFLSTENFSRLDESLQEGEAREHFHAAVAASHNFVDNFDNECTSLLFFGSVGTGKSFLSACISQALLESGHSVIYFSATDLFSTISDCTFHRNGASAPDTDINDLYDCDLLVIDDLGTEITNQFVCSSLFTCLNERHLRRRSTIISTNLSLSELHDRYSDRVFSRTVGNFKLIKLTGRDVRMLNH